MTNYDSTDVGVPYVRVRSMSVENVLGSPPQVRLVQELAVKLADGSSIVESEFPDLNFSLDVAGNLTTPIPLVDMTTNLATGQFTTLQQALACLRAVAIQQQKLRNP